MASDYQVLVSWDHFENGAWHYCARQRWLGRDEARGAYDQELKNNGYLDPGNPDIRDVLVELRFKGHLVAPADTLCTSERNSFSLAEVTKALASRRKS